MTCVGRSVSKIQLAYPDLISWGHAQHYVPPRCGAVRGTNQSYSQGQIFRRHAEGGNFRCQEIIQSSWGAWDYGVAPAVLTVSGT